MHINGFYQQIIAGLVDDMLLCLENGTWEPEKPEPPINPPEDDMITNKNIVPLHVVSNVGHLAAIVENNEEALHVIEKDLLALPYLKEDGTLDRSLLPAGSGTPLYSHEIMCILGISWETSANIQEECTNFTTTRLLSTSDIEFTKSSLIEYIQDNVGISSSQNWTLDTLISATGSTIWPSGSGIPTTPSIGLSVLKIDSQLYLIPFDLQLIEKIVVPPGVQNLRWCAVN